MSDHPLGIFEEYSQEKIDDIKLDKFSDLIDFFETELTVTQSIAKEAEEKAARLAVAIDTLKELKNTRLEAIQEVTPGLDVRPDTGEGIYRLLVDSPVEWSLDQIEEEFRQRSWINPETKNIRGALRKAANRGCKIGKLVSVKPDIYRARMGHLLPSEG